MKKLVKYINKTIILNIFTPLVSVYVFTLLGIPLHILLIFLVSILIHELGHYLVMKLYGYRKLKLYLILPFGAIVMGEKENYKASEKLAMYLAGPLPGILIGTVAIFLVYKMSMVNFWDIGIIFLIYNSFNLLPFYPLDGGRFVAELFRIKSKYLLIMILISTAFSISFFIFFVDYFILMLTAIQVLLILFYLGDSEILDNFDLYDIKKPKAVYLFFVYIIFLIPGVWFVITHF